jgi:hypothetical protein
MSMRCQRCGSTLHDGEFLALADSARLDERAAIARWIQDMADIEEGMRNITSAKAMRTVAKLVSEGAHVVKET